MSQGRFSTHILLIGLVLIGYNTALMLCSVGFELVVLVASLIWSLIKIFWFLLCNYPLTIFSLFFLLELKRPDKTTKKNKGMHLYHLILKVFASYQQCCICLQQKVNLILPQCGHCYHYKCVYPWIKCKQFCPFCRAQIPVSTIKNLEFTKILRHIFRLNKRKIILMTIITALIGYNYNKWYDNINIFHSQSNFNSQTCSIIDWLLLKN